MNGISGVLPRLVGKLGCKCKLSLDLRPLKSEAGGISIAIAHSRMEESDHHDPPRLVGKIHKKPHVVTAYLGYDSTDL